MKYSLVVVSILLVAGGAALAQDDPKKPPEEAPKKDAPNKDAPKKDAPKDDEASIKKALDEQKVTVNFDETPFSEAIDMLRLLTGMNLVVTAAASDLADGEGTKVSLKEQNISARSALEKITKKGKLVYEIWMGAVFVTTKEDAGKGKPAVKLGADSRKALDAQRLSLNFDGTPLSEVIQFIADFTKVKLTIDKAIDPEQIKVSVKLKNVKATNALEIIGRLAGLKVETKNGVDTILPRD